MSEIKVGEYVRTKKGYIAKVVSNCIYISLDRTVDFRQDSGNFYSGIDMIDEEDITKHSFNIIDLIEEGDYVNGWCIDGVSKDENGHIFYVQNYEVPGFNEREIKSIVTKERFKESEYVV